MSNLLLVASILVSGYAVSAEKVTEKLSLVETMYLKADFSTARCWANDTYRTCGPYAHVDGHIVIPMAVCSETNEKTTCVGTWQTQVSSGDKIFIAEIIATHFLNKSGGESYSIQATVRPQWDKNAKPTTATVLSSIPGLEKPISISNAIETENTDDGRISYESSLKLE